MAEIKHKPAFTMPMRGLLLLTGIYTSLWGAFFRWFGEEAFTWLAMEIEPVAVSGTTAYGTVGMITGIAVFLAAFYPLSWIYLIVVGIMGKLVTLTWFLTGYIGEVGWNKRSVFHVVFNEAIWLVPLSIILYNAWEVKKFLKGNKP
ncbi:hypothetical protein [Negadavirga shengliensis]|uniref:Uncharacterized protein n=1 Tax=Negadavirga shengliensis TaxID=1389218 RepID=A0ABV9T6I6_9BACT